MLEPVTLQGRHVRLEPLSRDHVEALTKIGLDPQLWTWIPFPVTTPDEMRSYVETALEEQRNGQSLPFAVVVNGTPIGSTRFGNISLPNKRVEIGWTWYAPTHQRTPVNTESKLLLLTHAFERLGMIRVELKTDALNAKSRAAIARIGGVQEGIFRRHLICQSGRVRDTVYFSMLDSEWPQKKAALEARLANRDSSSQL